MTQTICQVVDYGGPTGGSFIPALESLSRAVTARGERFVVIATEIAAATWPAELEAAGAEVHLVRDESGVVAGLRRTRPSIVHSHFTRFDLTALRAAADARVFWHVHSHREDRSAKAHVKAHLKYRVLGRRVEGLVAVSQSLADECAEFSAARETLRIVQNGIDTNRFRPPLAHERAAARAEFGIADADRIVLFFERVAYKGGATVKAAMKRLPEFRLLVAGGTSADRARLGDPPQLIAVERVAEARKLYWAADALAFASDNEAFGFVVAEALACGIPVAASDIAVAHEICGSTNAVAYFPVGDDAALAAALRTLGGRPDLNGRTRMIEHFDLARWTADMLQLYDTPAARSHAGSRSTGPSNTVPGSLERSGAGR